MTIVLVSLLTIVCVLTIGQFAYYFWKAYAWRKACAKLMAEWEMVDKIKERAADRKS